ncbi:MAG TPA: hypothetical protein VIV11_29340 [Kofleriaceae bacterium]
MSYEIADEPMPASGFENLVFQPSAPLLGMMWCGAWLAWPWFIVNSIAMGSPSARREIQLCIAGFAGTAVLALVVFGLVDAGIIESKLALQIALLGVVAFKLGIAYAVSTIQARTFHVYTYYGGAVQRAMYVLVVGSYLRDIVLGVSEHPVWRIVLSGGW